MVPSAYAVRVCDDCNAIFGAKLADKHLKPGLHHLEAAVPAHRTGDIDEECQIARRQLLDRNFPRLHADPEKLVRWRPRADAHLARDGDRIVALRLRIAVLEVVDELLKPHGALRRLPLPLGQITTHRSVARSVDVESECRERLARGIAIFVLLNFGIALCAGRLLLRQSLRRKAPQVLGRNNLAGKVVLSINARHRPNGARRTRGGHGLHLHGRVYGQERVRRRRRNGTCWAPCRVDICDPLLASNLALLPHHNFTLTLNRRSNATRLLIGRICNKDILAFFERAIEFALGKKLACAFQTHSRFFVDDGRWRSRRR